jgi:hypothetical protein
VVARLKRQVGVERDDLAGRNLRLDVLACDRAVGLHQRHLVPHQIPEDHAVSSSFGDLQVAIDMPQCHYARLDVKRLRAGPISEVLLGREREAVSPQNTVLVDCCLPDFAYEDANERLGLPSTGFRGDISAARRPPYRVDMETARSWNATHTSRSCSQPDLIRTGGNGLFYASPCDKSQLPEFRGSP